MGKAKPKPVPERPPVDVPLYTPWDVARYLRLPLWAVSGGWHPGWSGPRLASEDVWRDFARPVLDDDFLDPAPASGGPSRILVSWALASDDPSRVTFRRLAELFVRGGIFDVLAGWLRAPKPLPEHWDSQYRDVLRGLAGASREPVPFDETPTHERAARLGQPFIGRLDEAAAATITKHLTLRLERVETAAGVPVRVYPLSRDAGEQSPRSVVLDPRVRFGRPTLAGRGLPTDILFERFLAGDSPAELAEDYGITAAEVDEAVRFEARPPAPLLPFYGW